MTGELSVLNVGAGDIRVTFNQHDRGERAKAIRMLKDMQVRGYALLMQLEDGSYARVREIDEARGSYVVMLPEDAVALAGPSAEVAPPIEKKNVEVDGCGVYRPQTDDEWCVRPRGHAESTHLSQRGAEWKRKRGRQKTKRGVRVSVPIEQARVTGVARSAGG